MSTRVRGCGFHEQQLLLLDARHTFLNSPYAWKIYVTFSKFGNYAEKQRSADAEPLTKMVFCVVLASSSTNLDLDMAVHKGRHYNRMLGQPIGSNGSSRLRRQWFQGALTISSFAHHHD
ncbi:hypothetical protein F442_07171 [Phytophthora nicotianae P10297]|uniref:Uncharacterized protein n=1 Tax=Phytophthora nicotianae P10297 TaxID=1317064 RepID=W2ZGU9_PHYNI|nr:hypothetical protein F442_07171 [Phytophthora nicotianae P10297]